jgi:hypothetical protein
MASSPLLPTLGSYFTPNDKNRHAIVATSDGVLHEIFYNAKTTVGDATLGCFCGLIFVTAFYAGDDKLQHPVVANSSGDIFSVAFKKGSISISPSLANVAGMMALSGFYAADNHLRTLIVGTSNETIQEITYDSKNKIANSRTFPAAFAGLTHLCAFYSDDDHKRHAIVANSRGDISDLQYTSEKNAVPVSVPLGQFVDVISVAGFYAANDKTRVVIVATAGGQLLEITYTATGAPQTSQQPLTTLANVRAISAFYSSDDKNRHVIAVDTQGNVTEVWYAQQATGVFVTHPALANFPVPVPLVEYVGADITNIGKTATSNAPTSSPSGRCVCLAGSSDNLHAFSDTGGVWTSKQGGPWSLEPGSPVPSANENASAYVLAISPFNSDRLLAANSDGLWQTLNGGDFWSQLLDPTTIGANSTVVNGAVFDGGGRVFLALDGGIGVQQAVGDAFTFINLNDFVTAVVTSPSKVWARSANSLYTAAMGGATWSAAIPIQLAGDIFFKVKDQFILAATDAFAYLIAGSKGDNSATNPNGCATNNVLVIYDPTKPANSAWSTQVVTSNDKKTWQTAHGLKGTEINTCDGSGSDGEILGRRFLRIFILEEPELISSIGNRTQMIFGSGQEIWRAVTQLEDGTISDWNWALGTADFSNHDPVHADIYDFLLDTSRNGKTAWVACDGGVYSATVTEVNYPFTKVKWKPSMELLHTHQIFSMQVLRVNQISQPRIAYVIGDSSAFYRDTSPTVEPFAQWQSITVLGDGNFSEGTSSAPSFAWIIRQLGYEALVKFGKNSKKESPATPSLLINPKKNATFIDPTQPARFHFIPSPASEGQFTTADVVMMVDLPLVDSGGINSLSQQPGASSDGLPVLIRNKTYDKYPNINAKNAKGKGWSLERGSLPAGCTGFAVSGDRALPVYYAFDATTLYAERNGAWTAVVDNLVASQTFGPVFANPYDGNTVYVLTSDKGVQVSHQEGDNFQPDVQLNQLLNNDASDVNQISFNYDSPASVVVGTESGNLYFSPGGGTWKNLSGFLPVPLVSIRSVAIDCEAIYLGTHGRGLWRIRRYLFAG